MSEQTVEQTMADIATRLAAFEAWRGTRTSYRAEEIPTDVLRVSNAEIGRLEAYQFQRRENDGRYFAYWHSFTTEERAESARHAMALPLATITTWTGDFLARVEWGCAGEPYKCPAFGGLPTTRQNFRARGIDGREWAGTYYKSSGGYVRMRVVKGSK